MPIIAGPDGRRISFPDGTSDADIATAFGSSPSQTQSLQSQLTLPAGAFSTMHAAQPAAPTAGKPASAPGFLPRFLQGVNLPSSMKELEDLKPNLADALIGQTGQAAKLVWGYGKNLAGQTANMFQEAHDAGQNIGEGGPVGANLGKMGLGISDFITKGALNPFGGAALSNFGEDVAAKNVPGAVGSGVAALTQAFLLGKGSKQVEKPTSTEVPTPPATPIVSPKADVRVQQAVGGPTGPKEATIHVDPAFVQDLDAWNKSKLTGKRIILKTDKAGNNTVRLAHTDSDLPGYQYTKMSSSNVYADEGNQTEGQVPVQLYKSNGVRATSKPGHFLANTIGEETAKAPAAPATPVVPAPEVPVPAPQMAQGATAATPMDLPHPEVAPTPPSPVQPQKQDFAISSPSKELENKGLIPTPEIPKQVEKVVVPAEPAKGIQEVKLPVTKGLKGPLSPDDIPLTPGGVGSGDVVQPKPSVDVTPLEDKIRPAVGKLLQLRRLKTGSAAWDTIERGIENTRDVNSSIDPSDQTKLTKLLGEPVGRNLTGDQTIKLENLRGAVGGGEPDVKFLTRPEVAKRIAGDPEGYEQRQNQSMVDMVQALDDPNISDKLRDKITKALTTEGHKGVGAREEEGRPADAVFLKSKTSYPKPVDTPADSPEAPFVNKQLGHPITPLSDENLRTVLGEGVKDSLRLDSHDYQKYVTPDERLQWLKLRGVRPSEGGLTNVLKKFGLTPDQFTPEQLEGFSTPRQGFTPEDLGMGLPDNEGQSGEIQSAQDKTSPEFKAFDDALGRKVLDGKIAQVEQDLRSKIGEWRAKKPDQTPLDDQLAKLSPEAKKLLPEELFEKPSGTSTGSTTAPTGNEEPVAPARATPKKSTSIRPGAATGSEGINYTNWDKALAKSNPEAMQHVPLLQKSIVENFPLDKRQQMYARVMQTYHDGVVGKAPNALANALDIIVNRGEAGYLQVGKGSGDSLYTPEQNRAANLDAADRILQRWEEMSYGALKSKGEGLWRRELAARVEGTAPVSTDPDERLAQMDEHNEILERYQALKQLYGNPKGSMFSSINDWLDNFKQPRPQETLIRQGLGKLNRDIAIRKNLFESISELIDSVPVAENDKAWDAIQKGQPLPDNYHTLIDPKLLDKHVREHGPLPDMNDLVGRLRDAMDHSRNNYSAQSGNLKDYLENYMAGSYTNVEAARRVARDVANRSAMSGNSDFLKQKVYDFQSDAIKAGLDPVTNNWVRRSMLTSAQLDQAAAKYELRNHLIDEGYMHKVPNTEFPPDGWQPIDHPLFNGPDFRYYAPASVAKTFNNFVSTGLQGKWQIPFTNFSLYDAVRHSNNLQNMAQLSFSLFHASDIVANSFLTSVETGGRRVINEGLFGDRLGRTATERASAVASGLAKVATAPLAPIRDLYAGRKIQLNFIDPTKEQQYLRTTSDLESGNASTRPDVNFHFQQVKMMKDAWAKAIDPDRSTMTRVGAATNSILHAAATVPEIANYPLMKSIIPAMKLGAMDTMLEQVHREYSNAFPDELDHQIQKAIDSVDDRFGEVNWDNTFWNRSTKDTGFLLARALGWFYGTARQIGGGLTDTVGTAKDVIKGNPVHLSPRTAYLGAMVATTMLYNGISQYIQTGKKAEGIDYFYPKDGTFDNNGEANRTYPKFLYTYEAINWAHDPVGTAQHKLAPGFATLGDIYNNEDYYHHQIWEPGGEPLKNMQSLFAYAAKGFQPFSIGNAQESSYRGMASSLPSYFGVQPAPKWAGRTSAENLAYKFYTGTEGAAPIDDSQFEKRNDFVKLRNAYTAGKLTDDQVQSALDSGKLNPKMVGYLYQTTIDPDTGKPFTNPLVKWVKPLRSEDQVWHVWQAATPEEKEILLPTVVEKMATLSSGPQQEMYFKQLEDYANQQK